MKWTLLMACFVELLASSICYTSHDWRWNGKVAVVTGASSGIGAHVAVALADQGMTVIGLARREDKIRELAERTKGNLYGFKCDLNKEEDIVRAFQWIEQTLGGVDVVINNAGVFLLGGFRNGSTKEWRDTLNVNVLAMAIVTREALKTMRRRGDNGHIINMNSVSGHVVQKINNNPTGMYTPSKYAVTAITESLRQELADLGSGIKVTSISPGGVQTWWNPNSINDYPYILPCDISDAILYVLRTRPGVLVQELTIQGVGVKTCN